MKYFGTDGIRGIFGKDIFEKVYKAGYAQGSSRKRILLCADTRSSGELLAKAFTMGATKAGAAVSYAGVLSTPALSYAVCQGFAELGAVITASHNPAEYNGVKLFKQGGIKYDEQELALLESVMDEAEPICTEGFCGALPPITDLPSELYLDGLPRFCANNLTLAVDCANGATAFTAPKAFASIGANVKFINTQGEINSNCGVLHPEKIIEETLSLKADAGFVFDGDGDRISAVDENGRLWNGDAILYALTKKMLLLGELPQKKVVLTRLSNSGAVKSLNALGVDCIKTNVGDSLVAEAMRKNGIALGAEPSGHIICGAPTADGLRTALLLCRLLLDSKKLSSCIEGLELYPQTDISCPFFPERLQAVNNVAEEWKNYLGNKGRILVRPSGTEPLLRISVEAVSERLASEIAKDIKKTACPKAKSV